MDKLQNQVRRARRRLNVQCFFRFLPWCLFVALALAAVLITVEKYVPMGVGAWGWAGGFLALGVAVALVLTVVKRRSALDAAMEIDHRFGLKERVSSSLALSNEELDTDIGQALVADAMRRVERIHVSEHFRLQPNRWLLLPLAPAVVALLVGLFLNPVLNTSTAQAKTQATQEKKRVQNSSEQLRKKLQQRRKDARKEGLKEAERLFARLERGTESLMKKSEADRKQALVNLNDLAKDIAKRQSAVEGAKKMQEQLNQMHNLSRGPADRLAQAMKNGDFNQATREIDRLKDQLAQGDLDPEAKEKMISQLNEMREKLQQMVDAQRQATEELKKQIKQAQKDGNAQKAAELQKQLDRLMQQGAQSEMMSALAKKLGDCAQCMQQGETGKAAETLEGMKAELSALAQQLDELEMLDAALDEIAQAKDSMNCKFCNGMGCAACRGQGMGMGDGLGEGQGIGYRPEQKNNTATRDSKVRGKAGKGSAVVTGFVEGPSVKGEVLQHISDEIGDADSGETDPLDGQRLPRGYREHAKEYFDAYRGE